MEPLRDFLASRAARNRPASASLRALGEGGWWTQERLHAAGVEGIVDPYCRACGSVETHRSIGNIHHRCCGCPASRPTRHSYKDQAIIAKAQSALHGGEPLFQHGVPIAPRSRASRSHKMVRRQNTRERFRFHRPLLHRRRGARGRAPQCETGGLGGRPRKGRWRVGWRYLRLMLRRVNFLGRQQSSRGRVAAWPEMVHVSSKAGRRRVAQGLAVCRGPWHKRAEGSKA